MVEKPVPAVPGERSITNAISTFIVGSPGTIQRLIVVAGITADVLESNCHGVCKSNVKTLELH